MALHFSRFIVGVICLLLAIPSAAFAADQDISVQVTITDKAGIAEVMLELSRPVTQLTLGRAGYQNSAARIRIQDSTQVSSDGIIVLDKPSAKIVLILTPDTEELNSVYPTMSDIAGYGSLIYAPAILPEYEVTGIVGVARDGSRLSFDPKMDSRGYLYVGTINVKSPTHRLAVASDARADLALEVENQLDSLIRFYSDKMGRPAGLVPTFILTTSDADNSSNRGDVTPNGVVFLRYRLPDNEPLSFDLRQLSAEFLAHEIFHLWQNRESANPDDWWFHEGAAEYASIFAIADIAPELGRTDSRLAESYNQCSGKVLYHTYRYLSPRDQSRSRYSCGMLIQWLTANRLGHGDNAQNIWSFWSDVWPAETTLESPVMEFRRVGAERFPEVVDHAKNIFFGEGTERWFEIIGALGEAVDIEIADPDPFQSRVMIARSLVLSSCGEFWGAGERDGSELYVSVPPECDSFEDGAAIMSINGIDPMAQPFEALNFVRLQCAAQAEVNVQILTDSGERMLRFDCTVPMQLPPRTISGLRRMKSV